MNSINIFNIESFYLLFHTSTAYHYSCYACFKLLTLLLLNNEDEFELQ